MTSRVRSMAVCAMVLLVLSAMLLDGCGARVYESYAEPGITPGTSSGSSPAGGTAEEDDALSASSGAEEEETPPASSGAEEEEALSASPGAEEEETPPAPVCVHVCGAVARSGVYELPEGARVCDAVEAAGGITADAEETSLNFAAELFDGQQIVVLTKEEALLLGKPHASAGTAASSSLDESPSGGRPAAGEGDIKKKININTADESALMTLKGIGASRAADIIAYRDKNGPFRSIEEIMKVSGIKGAVFQKICDEITVE